MFNKLKFVGRMKKRDKTYTISAVAEMYDIHPQTLRLYEREGLLAPSRSVGNTRLTVQLDWKIVLSLTDNQQRTIGMVS